MSARQGVWREQLPLGAATLSLETGRIALQAAGAVWLQWGRMVLLAAASRQEAGGPAAGFFPLTVEYREKLAGAGRVPGGFFRREGRATTRETIGSRLVDRSLRPLFPEGFRRETQVVATMHSFDPSADPEVHAITAASAALMLSDVPWEGPVAGVRVGWRDGGPRAFPERATEPARGRGDGIGGAAGQGGSGAGEAEGQRAPDLDLIVAVSRGGLVMVEGSAAEISEERLMAALDAARAAAEPLLALQERLRAERGREQLPLPGPGDAADPALAESIRGIVSVGAERLFGAADKHERRLVAAEILAAAEAAAAPAGESGGGERAPGASGAPGGGGEGAPGGGEGAPGEGVPAGARGPAAGAAVRVRGARQSAEAMLRAEIRGRALDGRRLDGRRADEVRPISGEVACLPGAHGSSLFTRGETQALVTCTLGTAADEQLIEEPSGTRRERFMLHYNFPPYSVGEVRPLRGPGRREIGHGHLAWRALRGVLPPAERFPYTIRLESEITSSNGSSSMATVCGGALALMDAGVPLRRPVAGIAMGLISEGGRIAILSDILGDEDQLGDMDFKVAGSEEGVTAVQLDNKVGALPREALERALAQARAGRQHILREMRGICAAPRETMPAHAPRVVQLRIRPARIRDLIGPGGRHIQAIQQSAEVKIDIADDGRVTVFGGPGARLREAELRVRFYTGLPSVGRCYRGRVTGVRDFGCFVEIFHGIEGLVHATELDRERVDHPSSLAAVGDEMIVRVLGTTREGKIQLSRKEALGVDPSEIEA
ncbi:MAG: polyribonucleotide nucleotidyltransferase [Candidatus Eisenbacteria bacterium]|uniref:Polyribonucleotide nucleotidyltransferase n=1 Tax=Eiseniibacteriota bacterium TaxID=2212470 RepID=A0A937X965_UNCEI|nr:polyribonucleotide nucleotidyltransferase [Candidatus Eisenbacteria bacterium]